MGIVGRDDDAHTLGAAGIQIAEAAPKQNVIQNMPPAEVRALPPWQGTILHRAMLAGKERLMFLGRHLPAANCKFFDMRKR